MLRTAPTADLDAATLRVVRSLMDDAFAGEFSDGDWDHTLGGVHVLAVESGAVVGHGAVVRRQLIHGGRTLRCGYVEGVAVRADRRRRGLGTALMEEAGRIVRGSYDIGALSGTEAGMPLYERLGWQRWRGPLSALTPHGVERTPEDDDSVFVLPVTVPLDRDGELTCDWRPGELW